MARRDVICCLSLTQTPSLTGPGLPANELVASERSSPPKIYLIRVEVHLAKVGQDNSRFGFQLFLSFAQTFFVSEIT